MEALVLAGGQGTRLRPIVSDLPKPMAPVDGRPFLELVLTTLSGKGFERAILCLGYMAEKVVAHFGQQFMGMELVYEIENEPLGTGGAVRMGLARCLADHVYVLNGDTFLDLEVSDVELLWKAAATPIIVARQVEDTARYGRLDVVDGRVAGFSEKGVMGPGLINAGCYVLPRHLLEDFPPGRAFSLELDFLAPTAATSNFAVFVTHGQFIDIGIPEDYARAQHELAGLLP